MSDTPEAAVPAEPRASLRSLFPGHWYIPFLLLVASGLLLTGQVLDGVTIESMNREPEHYSVMGGVIDLWAKGNPVLAVVLFSFSILFPTAKLLALGWIWFVPMKPRRRARGSVWLEALGKWSMLDGFVVSALVGTIQLRKLVKVASAKPESAVYYFAVAILISMVVTFLVSRLAVRSQVKRPVTRFDLSLLVVPWLAAICLVAALLSPILRVEKRIFENFYELPSAAFDFIDKGEVFLGSLMLLFVMIIPLVYLVGLGTVMLLKRRGRSVDHILSRVMFLEHWAMVDVYFLGLLLVCTKVGNLATVERLPGFWLILAAALGSMYCAFRVRLAR